MMSPPAVRTEMSVCGMAALMRLTSSPVSRPTLISSVAILRPPAPSAKIVVEPELSVET